MAYQSMSNHLRVVDKVYTQKVNFLLEDFHFFSLSFLCIAKQ